MKRIFIILSILLIGIQQTYAQGSTKIESFNRDVLPRFVEYFSHAEQTDNGQLKLTAIEKYSQLSLVEKKIVLDKLTKEWTESLVLIIFDTKNELWGWNYSSGQSMLYDSWDLNSYRLVKTVSSKLEKSALHPWFFYIGGMTYFDSNKNIDLALNAHVGFFLLLNRWDLALSISEAMKGNASSDAFTGQLSLGLMSKVYFPIKELKLSPNIGGELDLSSSIDAPAITFNPSLLVGISWYVGIGSLDVGFKIGNSFTTMIGYTFVPQFSKNKK